MSTIQRLLEKQHGNLHDVIPPLVKNNGQAEAARLLGVHTKWVWRWLKTNGYTRAYIRKSENEE